VGFDLALGGLVRGAASPRRDRLRARATHRVVATLGALKGPYAKLGQFASIRHDLLPEYATEALGALRDRVPPLPFRRIRRVVETELGGPLEHLFESFEPEPLGAASIAQVHRARLRDGRPVAVKVQYPWLATSLRADLAIVRRLLVLWSRGARGVDPERLFAEFARGLGEELDFVREARIATEIAANLAGDDRVVVPRIVASHSAPRVLTMEYHPAVPIGDREALARLGVAPRSVLEILGRAYATQVFVDGLFHADPHPGNLFVIDEPNAAERPRLLFIDFGLSRRLAPQLRQELRRALFAVVQRDLDAFVACMDRLHMIAPGAHAAVRDAVERMFGRMAQEGGPLAVAGSRVLSLKDEAKALLQETPGLQLPNDLLLYAKTMTYVFALADQLDPDVDMMKLSLPYLLRFLAQREEASAPAATGADPAGG
jgi:predicted unusual protein kinase regulating ubiquinone biosynthesis (AarF/ABC1/UbiB family)